ncbi:hypothetical protein ACJRO7_023061 [Eucalyptus globulus]|uniref:Uncharacterized protein n=1 Tax=Eucalyptus globulus TaxID=34317 RepID=A0ABD3K5G2_EUCGL
MPVFEDGAFQIAEGGGGRELGFSRGQSLVNYEFLENHVDQGKRHSACNLIGSIRVVKPGELQCDQVRLLIDLGLRSQRLLSPTLNMQTFHTVTDWYNAYLSSRSPMEETWKALFSSVAHAKSFHGSVCFRYDIMSPLGYEHAVFKGFSWRSSAQDIWWNPGDQMIRSAFGFLVYRHHPEKAVSGPNVLFVHRDNYLAYPRHSGKPESRLRNEQGVFDSLKSWASNHLKYKLNLVNGLVAHLPMKDLVQDIEDTLRPTHIGSAMPKTVILEIISSQHRRPHFALISEWKGLEYHAINFAGSPWRGRVLSP